jgi:general secretion pathway protein D
MSEIGTKKLEIGNRKLETRCKAGTGCFAVSIILFFLIVIAGCARQLPIKEEREKASPLKIKEHASRKEFSGADITPIAPQPEDGKEKIKAEKFSPPPSYTEENIPHSESPDTSAPAVKSRKPKAVRQEPKAGDVVLNFDDADLYEVIRHLAELLDISYLVDPSAVKGSVTIHTAGSLKPDDLFPLFFQILEANGLTAVKEENVYKIISLKDAARMPITSRIGHSREDISPEERVIIQIIPLKFISVEELSKLLTPFISAEGTIVSHADSNTLVLVDKGVNIAKAIRLAEVFDINIFEKISHRVFRLEYTDAEEMSKMLTEIVGSYGAKIKADVKLIPVKRLNMLIAVTSMPYVFDEVERIIRQIDVPGHDIEPRIYVYSVKNGQAAELSDLLNNVFSGETSQKESKSKTEASAKSDAGAKPETGAKTDSSSFESAFAGSAPKKAVKKESVGGKSGKSDSPESGTLKGEIRIIADEIRNALVIEATPRDYQIVENILKRLDVLPRQVLIEVTIAEITLDAKTELGVEWWYKRGDGSTPDTNLLSANVGEAGLKYVIGQSLRWEAALSAFARDNKVNILSSPSVLASDNKEAKIDISTEIPVPSVGYKNTASDIVETSIQYRNTGIILTVTPHINEHGLVSMDINQEISEQSGTMKVGNQDAQSFYKRSVKTTLTVRHGQTIVIGGLIKETKNKAYSGLPCVGGVPVLQYLLGKDSKSTDKTELILLITPRVITTLDDVDAVTEEFKGRVGGMIKSQGDGSSHE